MLVKFLNTFFPTLGVGKFADNRVARLADLNAMVTAFQRMSPFGVDTYTALVTHTGGVPNPTYSVIACTCEANSAGGCPTCLNTCGYSCKNKIKSLTTKSTGVYTLEIDPTGFDGFNNITVEVGNLSAPGWATVSKVSTYEYLVSTYNSAGVATSYLLSDTILRVSFYGNGGTDYLS